MSSQNRILIVEDHTLLRQGLLAMLSMEPDLQVVGEAVDGRQGIRLASSLLPSLVLMDLTMPGTNGTEAISEIKKRNPEIRVLVLTVHKAEEYIRAALQAGADGYVLKHATRDELMLAIRSLLGGKTYLSPDVAEKVVNGYLDGGLSTHAPTVWESLTLREREVLKLIAEGRANKHIASYLSVSVKTVEKHRSNLMKKLDLHNAAALTAYAIERGMVTS
jgi:DNA-binding NarL/FixJ family response regulator